MKSTYIGPTQTFKNNVTHGSSIELENGKEYDVNVRITGPQVIINGVQQIQDTTDMCIAVNGTELAYSAECLKKHWTNIFN